MFVLQIVNPKKREHDLLGMGRLDRNALTRGRARYLGEGSIEPAEADLLMRLFSERERRHRPCYALCDHVGGR